mgnify:CR=1 FL=1
MAAGEGGGVFAGRIAGGPGAQRTDGRAMGQGLLLSGAGEFDSKPEMEIFADDVVCGHGSTSGQIDDELLFYLEARGIPEPEARALLIQAFVGEAIERNVEIHDLPGLVLRVEWYPRMDTLLEVEGRPEAIEH